MDARVEHADEERHDLGADAGIAEGKRMSPEHHAGPDCLFGQRLPHAGGVTPHDVLLEADDLVRRDIDVPQFTDTGREAIDRLAAGHDAFHRRPARCEPGDGVRRQDDSALVPGDTNDVVGPETPAVDHNGTG
jgi:hypothetical protein